jgi:hypothetical protein
MCSAKPGQSSPRADHLGHYPDDLTANRHGVVVLSRLQVGIDRIAVTLQRVLPLALNQIKVTRAVEQTSGITAAAQPLKFPFYTAEIFAGHNGGRVTSALVPFRAAKESLQESQHLTKSK